MGTGAHHVLKKSFRDRAYHGSMAHAFTAIDLFSGAGGFSLGLEQVGIRPILGLDSDERAIASYAKNFPATASIAGSIESLSGDELLEESGLDICDLVAGGPPCQAFSVAGRLQSGDARAELPLDFARLTIEADAKYFVMENVPGILLPQFGQLRDTFVELMKAGGYQVAEPWLLDAADFGVAQHRRRVFIVGAKKKLPLPDPPPALDLSTPTAREALEDLEYLDLGTPRPELPQSEYAKRLRGDITDPKDESHRRIACGELSGCTRVSHSSEVVERFAATLPGGREIVSRFGRLHPDRPSFAVRAGTGRSGGSHTAARPIHYRFPRCITVREAARLQSIPDWFSVDHTTWRGHMQVGNAVPPLLAQAVGRAFRLALEAG